MRKQKLENLTNEMVEIIVSELEIKVDGCEIKAVHRQSSDVRRAIGVVGAATSAEFYTGKGQNVIARDEVYASLWESLVKVSEDMDMEDISMDNKEFMNKVIAMTINKSKLNIIPASKKKRTGEVIEIYEVLSNQSDGKFLTEDGKALSIAEILSGGDIANLMGTREKKMNQFLEWFNKNKKDILTKKQNDFLNNELQGQDRSNASKMKKKIAERVSKAYANQYGDVSVRIANLMDQQQTIETILEAKDFRAALAKHLDEDFIIDALTSNVSLETMRAFNKGSNSKDVIREYRIALFKKLGEVITMIEAAK